MGPIARRCLACGLAVAILAAPARARGDDEPAAAPSASELRRRGDEAMDARRAAEALDAYRRAAALEPAPALDYNIGRALLATGDFAGALASFEKFEREAPPDLRARTHQLPQIMTELAGKVATVEVRGTPAGARVLVRGVEIGVLPVTARVNAGVGEIRIEKDGYDAAVETRDLVAKTTARLEVALAAERIAGRVSVYVRPANATVAVDGQKPGPTPLTLDLAPGAHELVLEAPSHHPRRIPLDLAKGEIRRVDITLDREATPLLKSPWFWGGVTAVVAAAVVTTIILTRTRNPDDGSLGTFHVP